MDSIPAAAPHVIMLPFPQKSHINPMMNLAQYLASLHVHVTFVYYGRPASAEMHKKILEHTEQFGGSQYLRVVVVPKAAGLSDVERAASERGVNALILKESLSAMEKEMESLLQELADGSDQLHPATCLVCDTLYGTWPQDVADKFGIPRADFSTFTATNYMLCTNLPLLLSRGYVSDGAGYAHPPDNAERVISSCIPGAPTTLRVKDLPSYFFEGKRTPTPESFLEDSVCAYGGGKDAKWVLIHSCYELERGVIDALHADKLRVHAIGPLLPPSAISPEKSSSGLSVLQPEHGDECLRWLDTQKGLSSVLYIALGTSGSWSSTELQALAHGVEDSELPFLWDLRPNMLVEGSCSTMSVMDILPDGFLARTKHRSLVVSRAPQLAVLAHPSVGGFLTHCEWNSIQEGIYYGVPMVGVAAGFAEQPTNMRLMTHEWKVGAGIDVSCGGGIQREHVESAVRAVMSPTADVRERVREAMSVVQHSRSVGSSKRDLDAFVQDLWDMISVCS